MWIPGMHSWHGSTWLVARTRSGFAIPARIFRHFCRDSDCDDAVWEYGVMHWLTTMPTDLFMGEGLCKTNKAVLAKEITKTADTSVLADFTGK